MTTRDDFERPATSVDVAQRAGVSRSTVSSILNGNDSRFPEATRERVRAAAAELDYRPSLAGRSLVSGRSDTIVVLLPNTSFQTNLQDAVDQVMQTTSHIGSNVVVRFVGSTMESTVSAILALRPLAIVDFAGLSSADRRILEQRGAIIVPDRADEDLGYIPDSGISELQAGALMERGARSLWYAALNDERLDPYGPGRFVSLQDFCRRNRLKAPHRIEVPLDLGGAIAALSHVVAKSTPVGIACYNDDVALALLAAARELKIDVPRTVSVVGVDRTPVGQLWSPPLTTVDTDVRGLAEILSRDLSERISGVRIPTDGPRRYQFRLIPGGTS